MLLTFPVLDHIFLKNFQNVYMMTVTFYVVFGRALYESDVSPTYFLNEATKT